MKRPKYLLLYEELRGEIVSLARPFGSRLPSRRQLAQERQVSCVTVEHSYELLCQEGYAEAREKSGYYVCYRASDRFAGAPFEGGSARQAAPPVKGAPTETFPFTVLARTMRRVLSAGGPAILERSPGRGLTALRSALARYLARNRGFTVDPEQIVVGSGAEYLYGLAVEMFGRERIYAIESPGYEKIEQVYAARGVKCDLLPLGPEGIRSEALAATRASVLHITPFRSYPTGVTASASKRRAYLDWAAQGDRYIIEDDFESEFSLLRKPEETVFAQSKKGRVVYLNSFSRTISPALRVGYMVLPEALTEVFLRAAGFYSCTVPTFEQYVLTELIDTGDFERHINRIRRKMRKTA